MVDPELTAHPMNDTPTTAPNDKSLYQFILHPDGTFTAELIPTDVKSPTSEPTPTEHK